MKISVITVCRNSVTTLERTIVSVIEQEYTGLEYIVVDGGSTDGTLNIINKYDQYIDRWISESDYGIFDAMNKGIGMSTGDVIAFLNSDDWYEKDALKIVEKAFLDNDCDCVCCDNYVVRKDGSVVYYDNSGKSFDELFTRMIYYHSAIFCRREFFLMKGNFDLQYKIAADYDWFLRAWNQGARLYYVHEPVFTFCFGGISSVNDVDCAREAWKIALKHLPKEKKEYREKVDARFFEMILCANDIVYLHKAGIAMLGSGCENILWGAGVRGQQCMGWFRKIGIPICAVVDNNEILWGKRIQDVNVYSPGILENKKCNLIITPDRHVNSIKEEIHIYQNQDINVFEWKQLCLAIGNKEMLNNHEGDI